MSSAAVIKVLNMILLLLFLSVTAAQVEEYPVVYTKSGPVRGVMLHNAAFKSKEIYYAFRGIPYAKPPVEELRFKPPVNIEPWSEIRNATTEPEMCTQLDGGIEDCLYLNVFIPKLLNNNTKDLMPVMVFLHGGAYILGSPQTYERSPDYFMKNTRPIVLVTIQYRLNVFGFLSTNNVHAEGNFGLKDQLAALKWINENIVEFGGNPNKITIFGQSAGAASVHYLLISPNSKGLFHQAISESGTAISRWALQRKPRENAFKLGAELGILTNCSKTLVNELRKISAQDLVKFACPINEKVPLVTLTFVPSIEYPYPGAILTKSSYISLEKGRYATKIPFMIGYTKNEANMLLNVTHNFISFAKFVLKINPSLIIPESLNLEPKENSRKQLIKELKHRYFLSHVNNTCFEDSMGTYISQEFFIRSIRKSIDLMKKYSQMYAYKFAYTAQTEDFIMGHSAELQYLFLNNSNIIKHPKDLLTVDRMVKLWTNFAIYGNPTPIKDPDLNNVVWETVSPENEDVPFLYIDNELKIVENVDQEEYNYWQKLFQEYGKPPYLTW